MIPWVERPDEVVVDVADVEIGHVDDHRDAHACVVGCHEMVGRENASSYGDRDTEYEVENDGVQCENHDAQGTLLERNGPRVDDGNNAKMLKNCPSRSADGEKKGLEKCQYAARNTERGR